MLNIARFVKAPKNIREASYLKRKYYHLVIRMMNAYNKLIGFFNPQRFKPSGSKELDEIRRRSFERTDISDHLVSLFQESLDIRPKLIVELGVGPGESSLVLGNVVDMFGAILISVDKNPKIIKSSSGRKFFINTDDIEFANKFESWCLEKNINPSIDILFIDTSHRYEHTLEEIKHWFGFLSEHSKVFFHDTNTQPIYWRKDGSMGLTYEHEPRGVMRAIEYYLGVSFNEKKDFSQRINDWNVKHYHLCNGFTILSRINNIIK